ncbi:MAG TPA: hypothetical protein VGI28_15780 [Stellaceae bacterium]
MVELDLGERNSAVGRNDVSGRQGQLPMSGSPFKLMVDFRVRYRSIVLKYAYGIGLVNSGAVRRCGDDD